MSISPTETDSTSTAASARPYPCAPANRFSLLGYTAATTMLTLVATLNLDDLNYVDILCYAIFPICFHLVLELGSTQKLMGVSLHTNLYEILGMLVWVVSFAYAANLLNQLRPLLLIGAFLAVNFSVARDLYGLGTRVSLAVTLIYLLPSFITMLFDGGHLELVRDGVFALSFLIVAIFTAAAARHFRKSKSAEPNEHD